MKLNPGNAIVLSREFKDIIEEMDTNPSPLFITGRAGTGKSTLLKMFSKTTRRNTVVLAPTGIAALNVKGQTIHSFFGFPPRLLHPEDIHVRRNRSLFRNVEIIIIDEISMVRADMLDNIDRFLQINRNNYSPFGGVKMVFFGDLYQLPPVIATNEERMYLREHYETPYFFSAKVFDQDYELITHELTEVHRQTERNFINILDNIRLREVDYEDLNELNERHIVNYEDDDYHITLCTRNQQVNELNKAKLKELYTEEFTYLAQVTGSFGERQFPTDLALRLREGAQVMFIKNDQQKRYVNGTIGKIHKLDTHTVQVSIMNEDESITILDVEPFEWEIIKYRQDPKDPKLIKTETVGTFKQYPLKLSWAITIHKSQGKTFNRVIIDLGKGSFESGQTYVALSRCRTLNGITLRQALTPRDILVDPIIADFYHQAR